jgi:hypothetical protein
MDSTSAVAVEREEPRLGVAWERLEDQIDWYDRKSIGAQRWFKRLKVGQLVFAALIPVLAAAEVDAPVLAALGAAVVVAEGSQQLFQWQQNWITYRATCEALKHEKFMYLAAAGPYAGAARRQALLAERVEGLVSQEHARWTASQEQRSSAEAAPPLVREAP